MITNDKITENFSNFGSTEAAATRPCTQKSEFFALHCTRFFVTLTSSKLLSLGLARKKASLFCTQCTLFSVTLHTYEKRLNSHSTP